MFHTQALQIVSGAKTQPYILSFSASAFLDSNVVQVTVVGQDCKKYLLSDNITEITNPSANWVVTPPTSITL